jgi:nicotinate-nucleotide pyrophosphorylase
VRDYADAGADFVSIGALTHSVVAGDVALELQARVASLET